MSGPKVVRVVTREELQAVCQGQLRRLDAAMQEWLRIGRRNDTVNEEDVKACGARIARLRELLAAGRFAEIQKEVPAEVAYLQNDQKARLAKAAAAAAAARSQDRQRADAAAGLLAALQRAGKPLDAKLRAAIEVAAKGNSDLDAMAKGYALLTQQSDVTDEAKRRELAQKHKVPGGTKSFEDWLTAQPISPDDAKLARLEKRLAELTLLSDTDATDGFETWLTNVRAERVDARRNLLLDSLEMDLSRALSDTRALAVAAEELRLSLAELEAEDAATHATLLAKRDGAATVAELRAVREESEHALLERRNAMAAAHRRAAILKGLAGLGYEVTEGLATAWVEQGHVVLKKAAQTEYGIELSGEPSGQRMQVRVVAFADGTTATDAARDRDAEAAWCGDVASLKDSLAKMGGGMVIEKGMPVGATAVRRVAVAGGRPEAERSRKGLSSRSLE
jgi:hypothetical protein